MCLKINLQKNKTFATLLLRHNLYLHFNIIFSDFQPSPSIHAVMKRSSNSGTPLFNKVGIANSIITQW